MYPCETETVSDEDWEGYEVAQAEWEALSPEEQDALLESALEDAEVEMQELGHSFLHDPFDTEITDLDSVPF